MSYVTCKNILIFTFKMITPSQDLYVIPSKILVSCRLVYLYSQNSQTACMGDEDFSF
jgi:hypothetical protein